MQISDLQKLTKEQLLKYLAYLQVCPEDSSFLQTFQEYQCSVLSDEDILSDGNLWMDFEEIQTGLFVENYICYSVCQFRAFVSDATERPWQLCSWVEFLIKNEILTIKQLYPVIFFLCLSDKIAERLGLDYYVLGNHSNNSSVNLLELDRKKQDCLSFTNGDLDLVGHEMVKDLSFLRDYYADKGTRVESKPLLPQTDGIFVLSPNSLMNCAWRELLKALKTKRSDLDISMMYHAALAEEIHNSLSSDFKWPTNINLREHADNMYSAVYQVYFHKYFIVTVVAKELREIKIDEIEHREEFDVVDVSTHLNKMYKKVEKEDADAEIVHIVIPLTMQNELVTVSSNVEAPVMMIRWQPLRTLLKKDEDNMLWLFYYAIDRKDTKVVFSPNAREEDIIALYLKYEHSFYLSDKAKGKQFAYVEEGFSLPLMYDIKRKGNRHTITDSPFQLIIEKEQDNPEGLPFYELHSSDCDIMVGEFMISSIIVRLPKGTKEHYPDLHGVGRSLILWYYALERKSGRPVMMRNLKLSVEQDDYLISGFTLDEKNGFICLHISRQPLGNEDGHSFEKRLLETVLSFADRQGMLLDPDYKSLIEDVFVNCQGGLIHLISSHDLLCDTTIGEKHHYVVDSRRKAMVIGELAAQFNHYDIGPLSVAESRNLVNEMVHYLNRRITGVLEQYDLERLISSLMTLRDGLIFWNRTMTVRYNYMISFYRYLGSDDPVQEKKIHQFVETDLCTRCLIEYALMKCDHHGEKLLDLNMDTIEEMFALMSELINMGYLSDYYQSESFDGVIEVLPNGRFAYPTDEESGLSRYVKAITLDRLEHPDVFEELSHLVKDIEEKEYEKMFEEVFSAEFGLEFGHFKKITSSIIQILQDKRKGDWMEEVGSFKAEVSKKAMIDVSVVSAYINAFSISADFHDLTLFPMFKEHDTFPCRYKRRLGLINRPLCVFKVGDETKVAFSYRGFVQSQFHLLDNIRLSNYAGVSDVMKSYIGSFNNKRGRNFEAGVYEFYKKQKGLICHRSAEIGPKDRLYNPECALGDIDIMLIDNVSQRILLIEAKNYNECKTPYEAVESEKKMMGDLKKVVKRNNWAKEHKSLFDWYANKSTDDYRVASILLTFNMSTLSILRDDYKTEIPIVWMRDVIENPMTIFEYGEYA